MSRRLLITIPYFPPDPKAGGAEMFVVSVAEGLTTDHGWEVTIVTTTSKDHVEIETGPAGVAVYRLPYKFTLSNSPISMSWLRELKRLIKAVDPDVIKINIPVPGLGDMAIQAAGRRPLVIYYHFGSMKKGRPVLDALIWLYESLILPLGLRRANHIVCGSTYVRDGVLSGFGSKTSIIQPGVDTVRFHPAAQRVAKPRVLYVGSLNRSDQHKRFSDLLEACAILRKDLPDLRLCAVGGGDGRGLYEDMAARLGIGDSVRFTGRLSGDSLADAYRDAAVFALPSTREAFGMVVTEAMASGLPIVAVNGGGVTSVLDENKDCLLVPAHNPQALANALKTILTNPDKADAMGRAGRAKVSELLVWKHQIASIDKVLIAAAGLPSNGEALP
jgi:glycosyltransferase involved in cell wall biosynthesis